MIDRFDDNRSQIQPESRANTADIAIDAETELIDVASAEHARGAITTATGRTEPPPARFFTCRE